MHVLPNWVQTFLPEWAVRIKPHTDTEPDATIQCMTALWFNHLVEKIFTDMVAPSMILLFMVRVRLSSKRR